MKRLRGPQWIKKGGAIKITKVRPFLAQLDMCGFFVLFLFKSSVNVHWLLKLKKSFKIIVTFFIHFFSLPVIIYDHFEVYFTL